MSMLGKEPLPNVSFLDKYTASIDIDSYFVIWDNNLWFKSTNSFISVKVLNESLKMTGWYINLVQQWGSQSWQDNMCVPMDNA